MKKALVLSLFLLFSSLLWASGNEESIGNSGNSQSQNRYALVIGNSTYPKLENRLPNAINDSQDISTALHELGYQVVLKKDLRRLEMIREIDSFISLLNRNSNSEGFFWYAGHGCEIDGEVFLMPLDVETEDDFSIKNTSYSMKKMTTDLAKSQNKINVIVLDACREIPGDRPIPVPKSGNFDLFPESDRSYRYIDRVTNVPADMLIIYSTSPGTKASDGERGKRNSPFAEAFLANIKSTEPVEFMLKDVKTQTLALTKQIQCPWWNGSLGSHNKYYSFNNNGSPQPEPVPPVPTPSNTDFLFEIMADNILITGYKGTSQTLTIPDRIQNLPVTVIGEKAFKDNKTLKAITIPSSVTIIANEAFSGCENLSNVLFPSSIIYIGNFAFYNCSNFTSITIPSSVTVINPYTFAYCKNLINITIPQSVTKIEYDAFSNCGNLTNLTIPSTVTSIGDSAFANCSKITNITIPSSVTKIGKEAFSHCSSLTSINVESHNPNFSSINGVLFDKDKLVIIRYPQGKNENTYTIPSSVTSIGYCAFQSCSNLTSITIPSSVAIIDSFSFSSCSNLSNINIPSSVTTINSYAFFYCGNLTNITIPSTVTSIGDSAFVNCSKITNITIPSSVTKIGKEAFSHCSSLTSINVESHNPNFSSINGVLFDKDKLVIIRYPQGKNENTYTIPSSVTSIGYCAFQSCSNLTSITIPSSVAIIDSFSFSGCSNLSNINIPSSVTTINSYAFFYCGNLTNITIPSSVTSIGDSAFSSCNNLALVTMSRRTKLGNNVFPNSKPVEINYID